MGYIQEPKNIDFVVTPSTLSEADKNFISNAIATYRKTGEIPADVSINAKDSLKVKNKVKILKNKKVSAKAIIGRKVKI